MSQPQQGGHHVYLGGQTVIDTLLHSRTKDDAGDVVVRLWQLGVGLAHQFAMVGQKHENSMVIPGLTTGLGEELAETVVGIFHNLCLWLKGG